MSLQDGPPWHVQRIDGLLVPGFTKRFDDRGREGVTYLWGMPIGRFAMIAVDGGATELRYRRWPIIDELDAMPDDDALGPIDARGSIHLPGGRRLRFCRFRLER